MVNDNKNLPYIAINLNRKVSYRDITQLLSERPKKQPLRLIMPKTAEIGCYPLLTPSIPERNRPFIRSYPAEIPTQGKSICSH